MHKFQLDFGLFFNGLLIQVNLCHLSFTKSIIERNETNIRNVCLYFYFGLLTFVFGNQYHHKTFINNVYTSRYIDMPDPDDFIVLFENFHIHN